MPKWVVTVIKLIWTTALGAIFELKLKASRKHFLRTQIFYLFNFLRKSTYATFTVTKNAFLKSLSICLPQNVLYVLPSFQRIDKVKIMKKNQLTLTFTWIGSIMIQFFHWYYIVKMLPFNWHQICGDSSRIQVARHQLHGENQLLLGPVFQAMPNYMSDENWNFVSVSNIMK